MGNHDGRDRRRIRRRRRITIGAVALGAVLGGGVYAVSTRVDPQNTAPLEPGALAPLVPAPSPAPSPSPPPSPLPSLVPDPAAPISLPPPVTPAKNAARASVSPAAPLALGSALAGPAASPPPRSPGARSSSGSRSSGSHSSGSGSSGSRSSGSGSSGSGSSGSGSSGSGASDSRSSGSRALDERIRRELGAAGLATGGDGAGGLAPGEVGVRSEPRANGSLRVITARSDLTGERELAWAADSGRRIGEARCTQRMHFSDDARPSNQPNLLLCWRTSAARSVVTLMVDFSGHPSIPDSLDVIDREWAALR